MKRLTLAALLCLLSGLASASCFVHPETGLQHCTSASECAPGATWTPSTQACGGAQPVAPPTCTGTDSGSYVPERVDTNLEAGIAPQYGITLHEVHWIRVGPIVSVTGEVLATTDAPADGLVQFHLSAPVASRFADHFQLRGLLTTSSGVGGKVLSFPDSISSVRFNLSGVGAPATERIAYTYAYRITGC